MKAGHLDRSYAAVWTGDFRFEASPLFGLDPAAHLQRCRELVAQGYRMVALSVARTSPEGPPITASVWHRPVITEETRDRLAERQARAAVALLRMGKADEIMPLLRHSADPRLRSFIVNWLSPLGADPKTIAAELDRISPRPPSPRPPRGNSSWTPSSSTPRPRAAGADPGAGDIRDGGTVSRRAGAADRQAARPLPQRPRQRHPRGGGMDPAAMEAAGEAQGTDAELMKVKDWGDRRWYVNSQGQTFAVIEGPVEFRMGSPPTEPERNRRERDPTPHGHPPPFRHRRQGGHGRAVPAVRERTNTAVRIAPSFLNSTAPIRKAR